MCRTLSVVYLLAIAAAHGANLSPVTVTGYNRDVVVENNAVGPPFNSYALNFNSGETNAFYQSGLPGHSFGLPASGSFTSALGDGTVFQLQPYTANNVLDLSSDTGLTNGTLTLTAPLTYSRIAVIANSGNGSTVGAATVVLTFNDASTLTTTYIAPDWFNNTTNVALQGFERINLGNGTTSGNPGNPRFYQTTLNLYALMGTTNKPLSSLTFYKPAVGKSTGIYAVSGLPVSAITLAVLTNSPASNVLSTSATIGGGVVSTGDEPPQITMFYGPANGGTNAAAWSNNIPLSYQTGTFSASVTGLTPGATYFFTARAVNSAGTAWATPSKSFTAPTPALAVVTNLPPTSLTYSSATLNGQVLSNGGDVPSITLFFGPSNGGTNPASWASNSSLGSQNGAFSQLVLGLSPTTTYFYAARAVNFSGTSWAIPSASFTTPASNFQAVAVLTQHNDNSRTGDNLKEINLNIGNVNTNQFGLIYTRPVDDQIYAQPLVMTNVTIPGKGTHNIVYVETVNDTVYAFDADDSTVSAPYWQTNFTGTFLGTTVVPPLNTDMTNACGGNYRDFSGHMGIVGTPVIDPVTQTMWLVVRTKETTIATTNFVQRLHALDITTGMDRVPAVVISGSAGGVSFDSMKNNQRPALAYANGNVYIGWSSHCDWGPYHGWVMAYNASTLAQVAVYVDTPTGSNGGIWMSGQGPAADTNGNIYISTGNGTTGAGSPTDSTNRAMSFLKLDGSSLNVLSWFTPYNVTNLNNNDEDLGAGGILLIPGTTLATGGGKSLSTLPANLYVVNRDNMGGFSTSGTTNDNIVQTIPVTPTGIGVNHIHGSPVWWDAADGSYTYVWGESDRLHQFKFDFSRGLYFTPAYAQSPTPAWVNGMTGGMLSISANGTNAGTGIIWGSHQFTGDANQAVRPGILHAYNAQNVTNELWNSELYSARDSVGLYAKYVPPTVANGKVYMATFSGRLNVYGVLPSSPPLIYQQPQTTIRYSGDPLSIGVAPGGNPPPTMQWYKGAAPIPGATSSSYALASVQFSDAGTYSVRLTNSHGFLISSNAVLTIVTKPTISYAQTVIADSPIAYWRLDETNGSIAHDSWGGHDGTYFNVQLGQPGYNANDPNTCGSFGTLANPGSYVGNITGIDFSTWINIAAFSVEAWVNAGIQTNDSGIVAYGYGSGGEQFSLDTGSGSPANHLFRFSVRDANNFAHNANGTIAPSNTWQHVVGVCDEPNGLVHLYINGVENANVLVSGGIQMGTTPISIGSRDKNFSTSYDLQFVGLIDEVAIYNYALSAAQVLNHYNVGLNPVTTLNFQRSGGNVILTWNPGTLQAAGNAAGPYTNINTAASPYTVSPTLSRLFYRVRVE
ncbi:MAG: hypothetical protein C5B50_13630 [Verrucomicrobia bacterium]|nr:MAG: hypothetical protein C5B50_13630 [Verrucomicrobiota bacterium]